MSLQDLQIPFIEVCFGWTCNALIEDSKLSVLEQLC